MCGNGGAAAPMAALEPDGREGSGLEEQAKGQSLLSASKDRTSNFASSMHGPGEQKQQLTPERKQVLNDNESELRTLNSVRVVSRCADADDAHNEKDLQQANARSFEELVAEMIDDYSDEESDSSDADAQAVDAENDFPEIEDDTPDLQPVKFQIKHSDWKFLGPVPKVVKSRQILRNDSCALRVLGAEHLMLATLPKTAFASTGSGRAARCAIVHAFSVKGVYVDGKRYLYFACKDRGKTKKRNERSKMDDDDEPSTKEQIWLLAMSDVPSGVAPSRRSGWPTLASARRALADFGRCKSLAKASERIALCFSGTRAVFNAGWTPSPNVVHCETFEEALTLPHAGENEMRFVILKDTVGRNPDGSVSLDENGNPRIMTDGSGLMSLDLAKRLPIVKSGMLVNGESVARDGTTVTDREAPFGAQVRIRFFGGLAKGMLKSDASLPRGTIVLTESMVKVPPWPRTEERFSFDLVETDARPRQDCARTTSDLLPLLEHAGKDPNGGENKMASLLLKMVAKALEENNKLLASPLDLDERQFARQMRKLEERAFAYDDAAVIRPLTMFDAGVDPSIDAYLRRQLIESLKKANKQLSAGKIPIPGSMNLRGYPDCTGTLREGEVCVLVGGLNGGLLTFSQDVLVYKSPGLHPGDVRKVQCVKPTPEIEDRYLKGVNSSTCGAILFSTVGDRSIADMIANSDFDGDNFLVIHDDELVAAFKQQHAPSVGTPESDKRAALGRREVTTLPDEKLDVLLCSLLWPRTNLLGELTALWHAAAADDRAGAAGAKALQLAGIHSNALDAEKNGWAVCIPVGLRQNKRFPSYLQDHPWVSTRNEKEREFYESDGPLRAEVFNAVDSKELIEEHEFHKDEDLDWPNSYHLREKWIERVEEYKRQSKNGSFKDRKEAADKYHELLLQGRSEFEIEFGSEDLFAHASAIYFASYGARQPYFAWHVAGDVLCTMKKACYLRRLRERTNVKLNVGNVSRVWERLRKARTSIAAPPRMETFMDKLDRAA